MTGDVLRGALAAFALAASMAGCTLLDTKEELVDPDGDGWAHEEDCDDSNPAINPGASDALDGGGTDQNCDGVDGTDGDGDGYASEATGGADCDDLDGGTHPSGTEFCDGADNDCDEIIDEDDAADALTWYADTDIDGYGDAATSTTACSQPEGYLAAAGDCDDQDDEISPEVEEAPYNDIDDDCDATTPDDDLDGDGVSAIDAGGTDCDDENAMVHPGASEVCDDGLVNDCDSDEASAMAACGFGGTMSLSGADLKLIGEASEDYAGNSVSGAGDVDGDGLDDLIVGTYLHNSAAPSSGAAYLLLGSGVLGTTSSTLSLSGVDLKLTGEASEDYAGYSVSGAGDVDGDGLDDLIVGAFGDDTGGSLAGAVYLLLGGSALATIASTLSLSDADLKLTGEASEDYAGRFVSGAGDVDGDGLDDLVVGAQDADSVGSNAGAAYLLFGGGALGTTSTQLSLSGADLKFTGEVSEDYAGRSVSGAGDVDGDGLDDLVIGAYRQDSGDSDAGAAYLLFGGGAIDTTSSTLSLSGADLKLVGKTSGDYAGYSVSDTGDVDGDGLDDLLIGSTYVEVDESPGGAVYLLLGGGALDTSSSQLSLSVADLELTAEMPGDDAGWSVSGAGDVDGDGLSDLLVGAIWEDSGGPSAGAAYLLLAGGALASTSSPLSLSEADRKFTGEASDDRAGAAVSSASDVDSDGYDDLLIGAHTEDSGGAQAGAAYLVFGGGY